MNVTLSPDLETLIDDKVRSGAYPNASAVVVEALRLLDSRDKLYRLRAEIAKGDDQAERGELIPFTDDLIERLQREAREDARQGKPARNVVRP